jgi:hypothetical protein
MPEISTPCAEPAKLTQMCDAAAGSFSLEGFGRE